MTAHVVGPVSEIAPGGRKIVDVAGRSIGVFNVDGTFYALRNTCPHQGAPLCLGSVKGTAEQSRPGEYVWGREGRILRCPWHGWEFDLATGRSVFNPHRTRVRSYPVTVEDATAESEERVETYAVAVDDGLVILHV
jgi:nitrite reductase/ring-hydroxylating ferredoxin subunit